MKPNIKPSEIHRTAAIELNLFNLAHTLPGMELEGTRFDGGTPIYDPSGEVLFYRMPLRHESGRQAGYADIAAHTLFGAPLLATAPDATWNAETWIAQGQSALERLRHHHDDYRRLELGDYDEVRLVAFSFPKLAVQFLRKGEELTMLELGTWAVVPRESREKRKPMEPSSFERWSLIEEMPEAQKAAAHDRYEERTRNLSEIELRVADDTSLVARATLPPWVSVNLWDSRELHYSTRTSDHHVCYELRGQETNVWCVAASVQMVLDFYRYEYSQSRIAQELGLGTLANPSGLPYANDNDVAVQLQAMSSGALAAVMLTTPPFGDYTAEIRANRPLVSFIPGHSRTVTGYTQSILFVLGSSGFQGLLVYDPWPPNAGVVTRWENFATQTYRRAFTAHVTRI